jgi:cysteine desulfurase/selenocysteine lyase
MAMPGAPDVVTPAVTANSGSPGAHGTLPGVYGVLPGVTGASPGGSPGAHAGVPHIANSSLGPSEGARAFADRVLGERFRSPTELMAGIPVAGADQRPIPGFSVPLSGARALDVPAIRRDFPILQQRVHGKPLAWLDNAATTQKPQCVIDALSRFYSQDNSNIHRGAHTLAARATDAFEDARKKVQTFLGASTVNEIVFVRGTTEGINLVAQTYGRKFLQPGDEIILSTLEHHANIVPWQMIAQEKGAVIRVIPVNDRGEVMLEQYEALLGPRTKLVGLAHASNALGTILPVAEMTQMAKRYGARVLIDGAQSVAHTPINLQQLNADFFVFSGHKIFGPTGIGAVYAKQELLEIMPPWQGGGNMIRNVTFEQTTYSDPPAKFEAGTPTVADAVGLGAALDYVSRLGLPNIAKYEHELAEYATERLIRIPRLRLIGTAREKVGVLSFVLANRKTEEVGRMLDQEGIAVRAGHHCAQPSLRRFGVESTVRPSLAFYNTPEEIDRLADAVQRIATEV